MAVGERSGIQRGTSSGSAERQGGSSTEGQSDSTSAGESIIGNATSHFSGNGDSSSGRKRNHEDDIKELRCGSTRHGILVNGLLEVKCRHPGCSVKGAVVLHLFNLETGDFETKVFKEPRERR
jgi:hypothetical protein